MTDSVADLPRSDAGATPPDRGRVVPASASHRTRQGAEYSPGVSAESVGAQALWLGTVSLPPGGRTRAHVHERHETAIYMLSGEAVELWTGDRLQHRDAARPGDYLFIPANVLHVAVNRGAAPALFVVARSEPTAHESMVLRPEMDAAVP